MWIYGRHIFIYPFYWIFSPLALGLLLRLCQRNRNSCKAGATQIRQRTGDDFRTRYTAGLPDFYWQNIPKRDKIYQMAMKYTKRSKNRPKRPQNTQMAVKYMYQMAIKYSKFSLNMQTSSIAIPSKIYPKCNFLLENKPSGSRDTQ
jgi:hypothetical protein